MLRVIEKYPFLVPSLAVIVYLLAIPVDIMEIDSAQYAGMARELIERNDYLHFYDRGVEYLDKPPLIFWISAFFYKIFGVNEFAFKLPSILFSIGGIYAVYRFTLLYYDRQTATMAAAILATTQGYFHFNNDVRTDTYLTNAVIMSVWMLAEFLKTPRWYWWVSGFFMMGIAMLAKGPMGLVAPALALSTHFVLTRSWKDFFRWQWLAGLGIILIVLTPMMIGLYEQFDSQPAKWVNGRQAVSGLRFFFWEQSFGRITGENVWKNDTGPFFFVHNLAWSFLPWSMPLVFALVMFILGFYSKKTGFQLPARNEWMSMGGFLLPFIALSTSHYKLPHYIYVVFPFAAVIAADWMVQVFKSKQLKGVLAAQGVVLLACWVFAGLIFVWFFPLNNPLLVLVAFTGLGVCIYGLSKADLTVFDRFMVVSLSSVLAVNVLLALHFYPSILAYQAPGVIAKKFDTLDTKVEHVYHLHLSGRAMDFYSKKVIPEISINQIDSLVQLQKQIYIHTNDKGLQQLKEKGYQARVVLSADNYSITLLSMNFGNPSTRASTLDKHYLVVLP